nr:coiled-coil domain-containing protein 42 like-2-like [Danio rerio]|eukprot:XP_009299693.1 coiled-coil domain-containing protein 42 like-2-like [Danio rerio]
MAEKMNLEDYFRLVFEERLSLNKAEHEGFKDMKTTAMQLLEAREQSACVSRALEVQKEEMQMKQESLKEREENIKKEEEKLKNSLLQYNKFLQENDARRLRAIKKAEAERAQTRLKELEIQKLKTENDVLLARKELLEERVGKAKCYQEFLERAAKMSRKFENPCQVIDRIQALQSINKELLENQTVLEKERERTKLELMQYINKQRTALLHYNNQLHQLQTQLDNIRIEAYKWEIKLKHFQTTAAKETLEFAQLKTTVRNIYQMIITHYIRRVSEHTEDTFKQLETIQKYFQLMEAIDEDLKFNIMPNRTEENGTGD